MNMLVTSQYQPSLSRITIYFPGGSGNQIAVFTSIKLYIDIAYVLVAIYKHVYISRRGFFFYPSKTTIHSEKI